ncbi:Hypothetical protein R9X50_00585500 [Acrodontium crateriforme]|uniref:Uncharacterized protein n=1 Tax=Acrodontium crateriforme TaxID=150365 RepID=A0AAQ3RDE0_9PEZI|nr:Hypothetical protein R9X50_00585500 [Acrodontium crateriforme]
MESPPQIHALSASSENVPKPPPKSPPLAFAKTSNDALESCILPPTITRLSDSDDAISPSELFAMGFASPVPDLQIIVDQQAVALNKLHEAFMEERRVWDLQKEQLNRRIACLERLLKTGDHHSPAKSPITSPSISSPRTKPIGNLSRLPSIAENQNIPPSLGLGQRREGAPRGIEIPQLPTIVDEPEPRTRQSSVVQFNNSGLMPIKVEEIPISPQPSNVSLSPVPPNNREMAGHTPLNAPRPPTPPPNHLLLEDIEDTPTRTNTHLNNLLTQSNESDDDVALKGPLNLPELPNKPQQGSFTLDALSRRLEQVARSPDESKPTIFAQPSPGMMTPPELITEESPLNVERSRTGFAEPTATRDRTSTNLTSASLSPGNAGPLSPSGLRESQVQADLDHGGIKLKKKPSTNFGVPFGQLGGFNSGRKMS